MNIWGNVKITISFRKKKEMKETLNYSWPDESRSLSKSYLAIANFIYFERHSLIAFILALQQKMTKCIHIHRCIHNYAVLPQVLPKRG